MKNKLYKNLRTGRLQLAVQLKTKAGVYQLINLINKKIYIGSSNDLYRRLGNYLQFSNLKREQNRSKITKAILKYGYDNFGFKILEFIELNPNLTKIEKRKVILDREQHYLNTLKPEYNINKQAESRLGIPHTLKTKKLMVLNSKVSKKIFVYNEDGVFFYESSSISLIAGLININRLIITRKLKKYKSKPVLLLNRDNTKKYIISYTSLNESELSKFILSVKNQLPHNTKQPHSKKVYVYYLDGKPYNLSPFANLAKITKEFKMAEATINKYAKLRTPYKKFNLIFSFTPI